jgi:2-dehydro-3-deoxyphosphogluconate aldolase / (4S)-4-hydroxy-2-oxoglutarate aldolase
VANAEILQRLLDGGVVPILRLKEPGPAIDLVEALCAGGINTFEIALGTPNALELIREVRTTFADRVVVGVGTVLDTETARLAVTAGAQFIVAPSLNLDLIRFAKRYSVVVVPGALTPTEILAAWEAGADMVKVFPVRALGPGYIKDVLAPLPQVRLVPVGGVTVEDAADYIRAGAVAVGLGGELLSKQLIAERRYDELRERAVRVVAAIREARGDGSSPAPAGMSAPPVKPR